MKAVAINGSPRKDWNTAQLLEEALRGAGSVGMETELIHLYDLDYQGCVSCFACKGKNAQPCRCYHRDQLSPVLEKVLGADVLFLGSPIYFSDVTGEMRSFLERLFFITMTYDDYTKPVFPGHMNAAFFFTMNLRDGTIYQPMMENLTAMLTRFGGEAEYYAATDTLQFDDYSKYHAAMFSEEAKRERRETQFPKDRAAAFEIGRRLASGGRRNH